MDITASGRHSTHWITGIRSGSCRNHHVYKSFKITSNKTVLETRGDCHHFMTCGTCHESAFGVQSHGHEMISWYHITKEQLDHMLKFESNTKTWVFMVYLGYMNGAYER